MDVQSILAQYKGDALTVGALGGHSALDVAHGAKQQGLRTLVVAQEGREKTYSHYYRTQTEGDTTLGCVDDVIIVPTFQSVLHEDIQRQLRERNTIFIQSRYFWTYVDDYSQVENEFQVPLFGNRSYVKLEERDQPYNQYHLLADAGIRTPHIFEHPREIDRLVIVKAAEAQRGYERAFFTAASETEWEQHGSQLEKAGRVSPQWREAVIEEFVVGAPVNFNFFYSPLAQRLELMGTDTRRQTNLDGFLRLTAEQQGKVLPSIPLRMVETGHIACTVKESLLEKAYELGEKFVQATQDHDGVGIIGPFALQAAVVAEEGTEDIVVFDVSLRIPGSPGTSATPYSGYLHGSSMSLGERIAQEIQQASARDHLAEIVT